MRGWIVSALAAAVMAVVPASTLTGDQSPATSAPPTIAADARDWTLILASIGIVMGAFGQVTVNDAMVGKYTAEEWRSRAYAVRYFVGFTAAGASVGLVAWLYERGGFVTMLQAFAALALVAIVAALILPPELPAAQPALRVSPAE